MPDYTYYTEIFFGDKIPGEEFEYYTARALDKIKFLTMNRCDETDESVKNAVCAVAEILFITDGRYGISSESSDGFSASYSDTESDVAAAAAQFLPSSLFYRGC